MTNLVNFHISKWPFGGWMGTSPEKNRSCEIIFHICICTEFAFIKFKLRYIPEDNKGCWHLFLKEYYSESVPSWYFWFYIGNVSEKYLKKLCYHLKAILSWTYPSEYKDLSKNVSQNNLLSFRIYTKLNFPEIQLAFDSK